MDRKSIEDTLRSIGFENSTRTTNSCFVNRVNSMICYRAQYFEGYTHCYILCSGEQRKPITSVKELQKEYYNLTKKLKK